MSDWWSADEQPGQSSWWGGDQVIQPPTPVYSGSILPFTRYSDGSVGFDSNAGVVGAVKNAITGLPGLARQAGAETAANTATPETAGKSAQDALMATGGDMIAPGIAGKLRIIKPKIPSAEDLYGAATGAYDTARGLGVDYSVPAVGNMAQGVEQALYGMGMTPADAQKTFGKLSALQNPPPGAAAVPLTGLESARAGFSALGKDIDPQERLAGGKARAAIDDFIRSAGSPAIAGPGEEFPVSPVLSGPADRVAGLYDEARGNYAAAKRSDLIENKGEYADLVADSTHSGTNFDNAARQRLRPLLDPANPQRLAGFTDDERQGVEDFVRGTPSRNAARVVGNLLGGGLGMHGAGMGLAGAYAGYEAGGVPGAIAGAAVPLVGTMVKGAQNRMASSAIDRLSKALRQRSPLYDQRLANAPSSVPVSPVGLALSRALLARQGYASPDQRQ